VDIYRARPETWGVLLLIRTGSIEHNIKLCSRARAMNMMLSAKKGVIKDGKVVASRTEEEIFKALEMDFVEPEKREV
jgi:DNA polymerase (family 10)